MEIIVKNKIMVNINTNNLLSHSQHGYVRNKACVTNLFGSFDFLSKTYAEKNSIDLVLLDFAKAFDIVPHGRLLLKISKYGLKGRVLGWIKAFLSNRYQRVVLGDSNSSDLRSTPRQCIRSYLVHSVYQ